MMPDLKWEISFRIIKYTNNHLPIRTENILHNMHMSVHLVRLFMDYTDKERTFYDDDTNKWYRHQINKQSFRRMNTIKPRI